MKQQIEIVTFTFVNSSQMLGSVQKSLFLFIPIQFVPNHDTQQMLLSKWKWLVVPSKPLSSKLPTKLPTLSQWQILHIQAMVQVGSILFSNLSFLSWMYDSTSRFYLSSAAFLCSKFFGFPGSTILVSGTTTSGASSASS